MASEDGSSAESPRARQRRQASKPGVPDASPRSTFGDDHTFEREKDLASLTIASVPSLIADARKDDVAANERAAEALHHLADTEDGMAAVAEAGGIEPLVALTRRGSAAAQAAAAGALWCLTDDAANCSAIEHANGIAPLSRLVRHGSDKGQELAAAALWSLAENECGEQVAAKASIGPLIALLRDGASDAARGNAAGVLGSLAQTGGLAKQTAMARAGVIAPLVAMAHCPDEHAKATAAHALECLAARNTQIRVDIALEMRRRATVRAADGSERHVFGKTLSERGRGQTGLSERGFALGSERGAGGERRTQLAAFTPAIALRELLAVGDARPAIDSGGDAAAASESFRPAAWSFEAAVLLLDISGFTLLSTRLDVDALQKHINQYFTALLDITTRHGGDALRFMGDALLVTWALPLEPELEPHELDPAHGELEPHEPADPARGSIDSRRSARYSTDSGQNRAMGAVALERLLAAAVAAACRCALEIDAKCGHYELSEGGVDAVLSVHSGLGVGRLTAFRVGSAAHSEFLVTGDVIRQQVATAMNTAKKRECVLSREAWDVVRQAGLVSVQPTGDESAGCQLLNSVADDDDGVVREDDHAARAAIRAAGNALDADDRRGRRASSADAPGVLGGDGSSDAAWLRRTLRTSGLLELQCARDLHDVLHAQPSDEALLRAYVHPVAAKAIQAGGGASGQTLATRVAELRRDIIVAFVKVDGLEEQLSKPTPSAPDSPAATFPTEATAAIDAASSEALLAHDLTVVQSCLDAAHGAIARHGGMLRQFVIDDKGAVIIWCFGLPGCAFEDNARRGLRSSFDVVDALLALGLSPRVGITLGQTFCGLVGAPYRCEYAVMGPCVNLAARLMGKCYEKGARVLCNDELREKLAAQRAKGEIAEYFEIERVGRPGHFVKAHFSFTGCVVFAPHTTTQYSRSRVDFAGTIQ